MDQTFLLARITATKAQIVAAEVAMDALTTGAIQEYWIDTGQTRTKVTKLDLGILNRVIESLYNRCATLETRLNGASVHARPAW